MTATSVLLFVLLSPSLELAAHMHLSGPALKVPRMFSKVCLFRECCILPMTLHPTPKIELNRNCVLIEASTARADLLTAQLAHSIAITCSSFCLLYTADGFSSEMNTGGTSLRPAAASTIHVSLRALRRPSTFGTPCLSCGPVWSPSCEPVDPSTTFLRSISAPLPLLKHSEPASLAGPAGNRQRVYGSWGGGASIELHLFKQSRQSASRPSALSHRKCSQSRMRKTSVLTAQI